MFLEQNDVKASSDNFSLNRDRRQLPIINLIQEEQAIFFLFKNTLIFKTLSNFENQISLSGELNIKHTCANSNILKQEASWDENHFYGLSLRDV